MKVFIGCYITFGTRMAKFFKIDPNQVILLGLVGKTNIKLEHHYFKLEPDFQKSRIEKLLVYSDVVSKSILYGGQKTNTLELISSSYSGSNILTRNNKKPEYKPLNHNSFDSVSMKLTQVDGTPIHFQNDSSDQTSVLEIHIKPVN